MTIAQEHGSDDSAPPKPTTTHNKHPPYSVHYYQYLYVVTSTSSTKQIISCWSLICASVWTIPDDDDPVEIAIFCHPCDNPPTSPTSNNHDHPEATSIAVLPIEKSLQNTEYDLSGKTFVLALSRLPLQALTILYDLRFSIFCGQQLINHRLIRNILHVI